MRNSLIRTAGVSRIGTAWAVALLLLILGDAQAGKLILRIRAGNPITTPQKVPVRASLPPGITPRDVLNLDGLELGYDVKNDIYYVHKDVDLGDKEIRVFNVELNDIWTIPAEEMTLLRSRADQLTSQLTGNKEYFASATALKQEIAKNLDLIAAYQERNSIKAGARAVQHINAYDANQKALGRVKRDIGRIENLVLGTSQDPGQLVGEVRDIERPKGDLEFPPDAYTTLVFRVTVSNTSPTQTRAKVAVKRDLPAEIKAPDILDSGELDFGADPRSGILFVYKNDVTIGPGQSVTYDVKIRDKWNIHRPRIEHLLAQSTNLAERLVAKAQFKSVQDTLRQVTAELEALRREKGPEQLDSQYVLFYRGQGERLDAIERKLFRIESVLKPIEKSKFGFATRAPSAKTTWLIIYIILGFLSVISLLFFFRWYGRSQAETLVERRPTGDQTAGEARQEKRP